MKHWSIISNDLLTVAKPFYDIHLKYVTSDKCAVPKGPAKLAAFHSEINDTKRSDLKRIRIATRNNEDNRYVLLQKDLIFGLDRTLFTKAICYSAWCKIYSSQLQDFIIL